jgi:hypothetical protein
MDTSRTTRFAGLMLAVLIAACLNGSLLWTFNTAAQEGVVANPGPTPSVVTLDAVTVVVHQS